MNKRELARTELNSLFHEGEGIYSRIKQSDQFRLEYQKWYSRASKAVATFAPDRFDEFCSYYTPNPRRKMLTVATYVIQDFFRTLVPSNHALIKFDSIRRVSNSFENQLCILGSIESRIDSVISNLEDELFFELKDNELAVSRELIKVSPRAAGALVGVVIEGHLQKVAAKHGVTITKTAPTISELNDPLKTAGIIDTPTWRKISFLADIRNLCSHKKTTDPTKEQVEEMITGGEWLIKTVI